jgi:myosin heavy subunit
VDKKKVVPVTDDNFNLETNLIRLNTLNEPVIMYNLNERYMSDEIYVCLGMKCW